MISYIFLFDTVRVPVFYLSKNRTENRFLVPVRTVNRVPVHKTNSHPECNSIVAGSDPSITQQCHWHQYPIYTVRCRHFTTMQSVYLLPEMVWPSLL